MPSDDDPPHDPSPPSSRSFGARFRAGLERTADHLPLAIVPLISALLAPENVRRVLSFREGVHFGVAFRFPAALPDLWTFVSLPNQAPGVHVSPTLWVLPAVILAQAALVAGLLGSVDEVIRTGRYDFSANVRRHFGSVVGYVALVTVAGFGAVSFAVAAPPLLLLLFPLFVLASYLLYAAPYLLVVADDSVPDALARSVRWAVDGGPYFSYGAGYLLAVAGISVVATAVVVNLGAVGILVGVVATAPVALALTFATTEFVADLAGDAGLVDDGDPGGGGSAAARPDDRDPTARDPVRRDDEGDPDYWDRGRE